MARSPKAMIYVYLKFSTDVSYERVQIFEKALREFIKSRPREWANFAGFRATKVWADLGYIGTSSLYHTSFICCPFLIELLLFVIYRICRGIDTCKYPKFLFTVSKTFEKALLIFSLCLSP